MIKIKVHPLYLFSVFKALPILLLIPTLRLKLVFSFILLCYGIAAVFKKRVFIYKDIVKIQSGVLIKNECTIKKENISAIGIEKGPLSVIFGSATLKLFCDAQKSGNPAFSVRIYKKDINVVYKSFEICDGSVSIKTGFIKTLWATAATSSAVLGFLVAMPFFNRAEKLFGVAFSRYLFQKIGEISENVALPTVSGVITLLLVVFYFVSLIVNLCKNLFPKTNDTKNVFIYKRGFPLSKKTAVFKRAVSSLSFVRPFALRIFGRGQLAVPMSAFSKTEAPIPNIKTKEAEIFIPDLQCESREYAKKNTLYRFLRWRLLFLSLTPVLYSGLVLCFPTFSQFIGFLCLLIASAFLYLLFLAVYSYKTAWIATDKTQIIINSVSGFSVKRVAFFKGNISEIKILRYPSDIKGGTCTVKITAYPTGESAKIKCITDNF